MRPVKKINQRLQLRLRRLYLPLWAKGLGTIAVLFLVPFIFLGYISVSENIQNEKESLYQNFYLRAQAFSLEIRTFLKDNVDLRRRNNQRVASDLVTSSYAIPVPESVRINLQNWLQEKTGSNAVIEFFLDTKLNRPRIVYLERQPKGVQYYLFEGAFLSQLLDTSQNLAADDRIFLYNTHDEPFLSNSIETEYQVPVEWLGEINKLFSQQELNGIQEVHVKGFDYIIARYRIKDLPLVVYLARPSEIAMRGVRAAAVRTITILALVALFITILVLYFLRDQVKTLMHLRLFIGGNIGAERVKRTFLVRDERAEVFSEIVQIRAMERRALRERDVAEIKTKAKGDFLANMSHEIRNPLNAILGIADLLRERATDEEVRKYLQLIRESGDNLLRIINDILDISKIENNKLTLDISEFDLAKLIHDLDKFFTPPVEAAKNKLVVNFADNVGPVVFGDQVRVRQILTNLLSNALKFTKNGTIFIHVSRLLDSDYVQFWVHDTGIGISHENIKRIFAAYEQAETSTTRKYGGTGLGLPITLRLAGLMHGTIRCRSRTNYGTSFYCKISLPHCANILESAAVPQVVQHQNMRHRELRILVAEDNDINQMLMQENLREVVATVDIAANGGEAIERTIHGHYDLIFMDIIMPDINGLEATTQIRSWELQANNKRIPIVALSGNAMPEDIAATTTAGCDAHLAKPVRKEQLIEILERFFPA